MVKCYGVEWYDGDFDETYENYDDAIANVIYQNINNTFYWADSRKGSALFTTEELEDLTDSLASEIRQLDDEGWIEDVVYIHEFNFTPTASL